MQEQKPKVALNTRIDGNIKEEFQAYCASRQPPVTVSAMVEWLIRRELEANRDPQVQQEKSPE